MWNKLIQTDDDVSRFVLRLLLGIVMFPHGAQKVLGWFGGHGFQATVNSFTATGMPLAIAILVIIAEFFGSLGLMVGFLTRLAAFGIGSVMVGAIFMVHLPYGFFMNWFGAKTGEGFEYHLLAIAIAVSLIIRGGGWRSVDRYLSAKGT